MLLSFEIDEGEAVFTAKTLDDLQALDRVIALDYLLDVRFEAEQLYASMLRGERV